MFWEVKPSWLTQPSPLKQRWQLRQRMSWTRLCLTSRKPGSLEQYFPGTATLEQYSPGTATLSFFQLGYYRARAAPSAARCGACWLTGLATSVCQLSVQLTDSKPTISLSASEFKARHPAVCLGVFSYAPFPYIPACLG